MYNFLVVLIVFKYIALFGSSLKKYKLYTIHFTDEEIEPPRGHTTSVTAVLKFESLHTRGQGSFHYIVVIYKVFRATYFYFMTIN